MRRAALGVGAVVVVLAAALPFVQVKQVAPATSTEAAPEPVVTASPRLPLVVASAHPLPAPAATAKPKPKVSAGGQTTGTVPWAKVRAAIFFAFGQGLGARMEQIARCETGGSYEPALDVGAAEEVGPLQVHPVHKGRVAAMGFTWPQMREPKPNAIVARSIFDEQGFGAWRNCA